MKVKQKDFDKLNQLDRIELMLREKKVNENNSGGFLFAFIKLMFIIMGFLILLGICSYSISKDLFVSIFLTLNSVAKIAIFGIIVCFIFDAISFYFYRRKMGELLNKFFNFKKEKVEVKNKR